MFSKPKRDSYEETRLKELEKKVRCLEGFHDYKADNYGNGYIVRCSHCYKLLDADRLDPKWAVPVEKSNG